MKKIIRWTGVWLSVTGLLLSVLLLTDRFMKYDEAAREYHRLKERVELLLPLPPPLLLEPVRQKEERQRQSRELSEELRARNPDYMFWLWIPGTNISYPVVMSSVPGFYLNHTFNGTENPCGAIFCHDTEDAAALDNLILYGHNMKDGTMFADLKRYREKEYYEAHPDIWIFEGHRCFRYKVSSCMVTDEEDMAVYSSQSDSSENQESVLTLSTCFGRGKRVIVQAVLLCYTEW